MALLEAAGIKRLGIQLAAHSEWENALVPEGSDVKAVTEWIATAGPDVAIESLFCDAYGNRVGFIGFRRKIDDNHDRCDFWIDVIEKTKTAPKAWPKRPYRILVRASWPAIISGVARGKS